MSRYLLLLTTAVGLALTAPQPVHAQPANNNFANAITISSTPYTHSVSTSLATQETGEQTDYCGGRGPSVWYRYTASGSGTVIADNIGSSYDTVITVFTGSSLSNLVAVACNDDWSTLQSYLPFSVVSGTTYYIRVNGYSGSSGSMTFHLSSRVQPQFTQCPAIGKAAGCEYLITAESDGDVVWAEDPNQPAYPNFSTNGRLIGVRNQTVEPLCALELNASGAFNMSATALGMCSETVLPQPGMCPFGPTEYEGPGVAFQPVTANWGTILFDPCIPASGSSYFSVAGSSGLTGTIYTCAENEVCGPDGDMDGIMNDVDNCPSLANPEQDNLDLDTQGDLCDSSDNQLVVRMAAIKQRKNDRLVLIKGSIFQSENVSDTPDASDGFLVYFGDAAFSQYAIDFPPEQCVTETAKITCESADGASMLRITTRGIPRGKAPFLLKHASPEADPPPAFSGPIDIYLDEPASVIERSGQIAECDSTETKIVCK